MKTMEIIKLILNIALFAIASVGIFIMGIRTVLDPSRLDVFNNSGLSTILILIWGIYCMVQALLIIHPRTMVIGCVLLLLNNIFIIFTYLKVGNTGSALFEVAAMSIPITLILLGHPYIRWMQINVSG